MSFTTLEDAALALNRTVADLSTLETAQINALILQADGIINNYCGWNMLATEYTDKRYNGSGGTSLDLRLYPVNYITQARVRNADGTFDDVTDGLEILDGGVIQFLPYATTGVTSFTAGNQNWFISFSAGFDDGEVPYDLTYAANHIIAINYGKITNESIGLKSNKNNNVEVAFESVELPPSVINVLNRYRLVSIF